MDVSYKSNNLYLGPYPMSHALLRNFIILAINFPDIHCTFTMLHLLGITCTIITIFILEHS